MQRISEPEKDAGSAILTEEEKTEMKNKCFAAIDLGTNSCRLLIADENGKYLYNDAVATKLGEGMSLRNKITQEATDRALACFFAFKQEMDKHNIKAYRAIATAACREAENGAEFVKKVFDETRIKLEVIDGEEEARLNLIGARDNVKDNSAKYMVVYDLGGGSTEITLATNEISPKIVHTVSIPWGARNAGEKFNLASYVPENAEKLHIEILKYTNAFVENSGLRECNGDVCFVATSSTPLRLASMIKNFGKYDREAADGVVFTSQEADAAIAKVLSLTREEMAGNKYIGEKRSFIFAPACVIFKTIYDSLGAKEITASLKSAKDGIIKELIHNDKTDQVCQSGVRPTRRDRAC